MCKHKYSRIYVGRKVGKEHGVSWKKKNHPQGKRQKKNETKLVGLRRKKIVLG